MATLAFVARPPTLGMRVGAPCKNSAPTAPCRRWVAAAAKPQTQWDGEGADYGMQDVERLHDEAVAAQARAGVFNGEGPDYTMTDVEALHDRVASQLRRAPDVSQFNGEGPNFTMRDVEQVAEEAAKDRAVRRK